MSELPQAPAAAVSSLPDLPSYLDGRFGPLSQAKVSVMDRGFIFGDGVYEVVPVYGGRPFRFAEHMARLERSLQETRIPNPLDRAGWRSVVDRLIESYADQLGKPTGETDQLIYLQVTRGVAMRDHVVPVGITPTVFATTNRLVPNSAQERARGLACLTGDEFRWTKAHIKSTSLQGSILVRQMSADEGANETIMFRDGWLSEGASCNVWVVKSGRLVAPPKDNLILEGIRYGLLEELCRSEGIALELRPVSRAEVLAADELLLSNAVKEVISVTTLDGKPVGNGRPGPMYERLYAGYQRAKSAP